MAEDYMWWGNARVTPWMYYRLSQLDADIFREFGVHIQANSGIRLASEQEAIWYARMTLTPNGRRVYSTRWWNGRLWYRISPDGEVAQPKTSNHEIQGEDAAVDIVDTGSDAGITSKNSVRGRWIRANAWKYDLVAEGDGFGEGWHYKIRGIFRTPPTAPTPEVPKEDPMSSAAVRVKVGSNPDRFHYFNVSEEFLKHCDSLAQSQIVAAVYSATDETHTLSVDQFWNLLDGQGVPRGVVKIETGAVLNPQSGKFEGGGVWSRRREAVAKLDQLLGKA